MVDWGSEIIINGVFERHKSANSVSICAKIGQVCTPRAHVYHARIKHAGAAGGVSGIFTYGDICKSSVLQRTNLALGGGLRRKTQGRRQGRLLLG